jgi:hypothetical protein
MVRPSLSEPAFPLATGKYIVSISLVRPPSDRAIYFLINGAIATDNPLVVFKDDIIKRGSGDALGLKAFHHTRRGQGDKPKVVADVRQIPS